MRFTVVWKPDAEAELADAWAAAADRQGLAGAADEIDRLLGDDPLAQGESHDGLTRIMFVDRVGVTYDVSADDQLVTVLHVWLTP